MNKLSKNLPSLQEIITEIGNLCESSGKYEESPHVIEILLPTICSYLNHWWYFGPSAKQKLSPAEMEKVALSELAKNKNNESTEAPPKAIMFSEKVERYLVFFFAELFNFFL